MKIFYIEKNGEVTGKSPKFATKKAALEAMWEIADELVTHPASRGNSRLDGKSWTTIKFNGETVQFSVVSFNG